MITSNVNTVTSKGCINNVNLNNDIYVNKEDIFDNKGINRNYNSNFDLIHENTNNKYMLLMNKDNIEEQTDKRIELKNMQCKYGFGTSQYLEQNCKINDNCTDLEKNVIIKEEIIIPDTLESDLPSNGFTRVDERFNNKTINWLNAKSILKPKIDKCRDQQEKISFTKAKMIIKHKPKSSCMIVGIIDTNRPPSEATVESVLSGNKKILVSDNEVSSSEVEDSTEDLESEAVLKSSVHCEKKIAEQMSASEIENEYFEEAADVLKTVRTSRKHLRMNFCKNGFLSILKNIAKLQKEKVLEKAGNNLMQTQENIPNNINHFKENNNNDDNNNTSLNIKIENVVSQARSFLKNRNTRPVSPNFVEKIKATNLVPRAKSILKPKIHILDTKANKIIIAQSESSGRTKLFRAKKIETPTKVIEQMKSKCLLFCSDCSIYQKIGWKDDLKKCTTCLKEMKYMCYECKEIFSSSIQFYVHDMCSCKAKLESGYYWKCNDCNYLVHKMTNCHQNFCRKHPLLKCKYCSSLTIHLSEFTKHSIKKSSTIKKAEHKANSIDEDNLGIELECTPLSSMPGQKLNSEKNFILVCPTGCKRPARKSSTGRLLCLLCGLLMLYKCLGCKALLKTYRAAYRHCSWCCSSVRTYYCASCDVFSQQSYDGAPPPTPSSYEVHRCRNCPARFDSRGKLNTHRRSCDVLSQQEHDGAPPPVPTTSTAHRCRNCLARFDSRGKLSAHRLNCDESLWLQCGLCPLKLRSPRTLREHLDEVHREHANVALRARVFKFAVQAWRRSADRLEWKVEKISESEKNRLKDENLPMVLLEKLPDHEVENLINGQKIWTCAAIKYVEDILPHDVISIISDEEGDESTVDRLSFFNSQQTTYLSNINSLLEIPDSDEEATRVDDDLLIEINQNSEIPFKTEEQVSHKKVSRVIEKLSQQKVPVERSTSHATRRRIRKRRSEPLRCDHCGYLTNAKMELVEHIMSRHAARLFRGVGFDCPRCSCVFSNYHIYERHLQSRHRLQR